MRHTKVAIVAHSDSEWVSKDELESYTYFIGVDRGAFELLKKGVVADVAIGDFDSVIKKEMNEIRTKVRDVREYPQDKDKTDLELAVLHALTLTPKEITLFGTTGGRLDQSLAALHLMRRIHEHNCRAVLRDKHNTMIVVSGNYHMQKENRFSYVSILPMSDEITISIKGCAYPLNKYSMKKGTTIGVSNSVVSAKAVVTVHKGVAYCIFSRDKA